MYKFVASCINLKEATVLGSPHCLEANESTCAALQSHSLASPSITIAGAEADLSSEYHCRAPQRSTIVAPAIGASNKKAASGVPDLTILLLNASAASAGVN